MLCIQFLTPVASSQGPISTICVRLKEEQEDVHHFLVGKLEILQLCLIAVRQMLLVKCYMGSCYCDLACPCARREELAFRFGYCCR
jgi:hypothetical protein